MKIVINGKTAEVPSGGGASGQEDIYSTEETRIGTWIDGKPIYRRVVGGTTPSGTDTNWHDIGNIQGFEALISLRGAAKGYSGEYFTVPYSSFSNAVLPVLVTSEGVIRMYVGHTDIGNRSFKLIVEYTKTTDQSALHLDTQAVQAVAAVEASAAMPVTGAYTEEVDV